VNITSTELREVLVIEPTVHRDDRGFFLETYQQRWLESRGVIARFVQDNHSYSTRGTLRGLHYQLETPQGKLVQVISGEVYDVAVDIRRSSATFGRWVSATLSADDHRQLWIPPGFAHGFYVLSESADVLYKCTEYYAAAQDRSLRWDDPDIGIDWPLISGCPPLLSKKDSSAPRLRDAITYP
jgi:dTDP-4-dehydrorhamnose 3,5-epimerase